jgi:hypothetical protein
VKPAAPGPDASQFLADTRFLLVAVIAPVGGPLFRWQEPQHHVNFEAVREAALEQWRAQAGPSVARLLPGCGTELLLPEAYYVACREADKLIRPVSVRAAVHYLTYTLGVEPGDLRAVIAGFGDEVNDSQVDEYRVGFTLRQSSDVVYGIVWPLYGQEDEEGTPMEGPVHRRPPAGADRRDRQAPERHGRRPRQAHRRALCGGVLRRLRRAAVRRPERRTGACRDAGRYAGRQRALPLSSPPHRAQARASGLFLLASRPPSLLNSLTR